MILDAAKHWQALRTSSMLTASYRRMYRPEAAAVKPEKVIQVLKQAGVRFVLMGTHGISGYRSESRATQDVDILVSKRDHRKAVRAIEKAYAKLEIEDTPVVTRFLDPATEKVVIDLMKPTQAVYQIVFKNSIAVGDAYRIPNLEMAIVSKYAAMISPNRSLDKKYIDAGDFINIVQTNSPQINIDRLTKLGDAVFDGGGAEIVSYVHDVQAGRKLRI